jgi:DNA-nicking Smr family endonuclease
MEIKKKQARKALDAMLAFAEREHAGCILCH